MCRWAFITHTDVVILACYNGVCVYCTCSVGQQVEGVRALNGGVLALQHQFSCCCLYLQPIECVHLQVASESHLGCYSLSQECQITWGINVLQVIRAFKKWLKT